MTALAPIMQAFFTDRLMTQRAAAPHTIASYRDTFRLLLGYVHDQGGKQPAQLQLADLDGATIGAFLTHLEASRGNSGHPQQPAGGHPLPVPIRLPPGTGPDGHHQPRPGHPGQTHRDHHRQLPHPAELDAILAVPGQTSWHGRRDHALLVLAAQTGLRVSEITGLAICDASLGADAHVYCRGKGRKDRCTPR